MKRIVVLGFLALLAAACGSSDTNADAPPIILDPEDGGTNPGTPDANVSMPGDPDANVPVNSCDNGGTCQQCAECSQGGPPGTCMDESAACGASQDCIDFYDCIMPCTDNPCIQACQEMHPEGANIYINFLSCVICNDCFTACDGAGSGCM